jgi:hypothetical protein
LSVGAGDANQRLEQPRAFAGRASAWFGELIVPKNEVARFASRGDHLYLMPGRACGSQGMP